MRLKATQRHTNTESEKSEKCGGEGVKGTYHREEHVLPEEVLRHELGEVPKVGWTDGQTDRQEGRFRSVRSDRAADCFH